jgi:hypothetical protein
MMANSKAAVKRAKPRAQRPPEETNQVLTLDLGDLVRTPDLTNATPEYLVDELGWVRDMLKLFGRREGFLKEALKGRWPEDAATVEGENYAALKEHISQIRVKSELVRQKLTEEELAEVCEEISYDQIKVTRKPQ